MNFLAVGAFVVEFSDLPFQLGTWCGLYMLCDDRSDDPDSELQFV